MGMLDVDLQSLRNQARRLDELSAMLKKTSDSYGNNLQSLSNVWKSDSSPEFMNKGNRVRTDMIKTSSQLYELADEMRRTIKKISDTEKAVEAIAKKRTFGVKR